MLQSANVVYLYSIPAHIPGFLVTLPEKKTKRKLSTGNPQGSRRANRPHRRQTRMDPRCPHTMSPQHLGGHAVPANFLGRGTRWYFGIADNYRNFVHRLHNYNSIAICNLHKRRGQRWWNLLHNFPIAWT